ncbi:hypothetical protein [Saccharopolyspora pogona]|uniref:hypothetical protein n=1 Tax=Saccharopolyspora pogona TaxID=333966 RepID=UPI001CC220AE|nr:hypothetical protein [Saccharopolyspora pogona]
MSVLSDDRHHELQADRHPLGGRLPGLPNVVFLAAFSGHGFKISPAIGDAAADLALTDDTCLPVTFLAADRDVVASTERSERGR